MANESVSSAARGPATVEWADPGFFTRQSRARNFFRIVRQLVIPPAGHRTVPTIAGVVLILLTLGIGSAAYNTSSNILFMTVSLLLSSLLLSGILSWLNFKGTRWRLVLEPHFRVGEYTPIRIDLSNDKKVLPTYSIWFHVKAVAAREGRRLYLRERLDGQSDIRLEWMYEPAGRGLETIEIAGLETQFPFGFLRKTIGGGMSKEVFVWPRRMDYEFQPIEGVHAHRKGSIRHKPGEGSELINVRTYEAGDPQRLVHWKASARLRRLMSRQMSEENQNAYLLFIETPARLWKLGEQFEVLCSFAASIAEDLYMESRLWGVAVNDEPVLSINRLSDLHHLLARLAILEPVDHYTEQSATLGATVITFGPGNGKSVHAYVGGSKKGSA